MNTRQKYLKQAARGVDYLDIKRQINNERLPEEERAQILKEVNQIRFQYEQLQLKKSKANETIYLGIAALIIGLFITIGTFMMNSSAYFFAYGAIGVGIVLIYRGNKIKNNLHDYDLVDEKPRKRRFDRF